MDLNRIPVYARLKRNLKHFVIYLSGNTNYRKVIIIGQQRTGSSLLASLLNSHSGIEILGEPFRLINDMSSDIVWNKVFSKHLPWRKYVGFRLFYYHPEDSNDRGVWTYIENDPDIKIIHIKRKNVLRSYVSKEIAKKTGVWNTILGKVGSKFDKKVDIDFDDFLTNYKTTLHYYSEFGENTFHKHSYYELSYEELVEDPQIEINKVFDFLGLRPVKVLTTLRRQNPEKLLDLIRNYSDLKGEIETCQFASELRPLLEEN